MEPNAICERCGLRAVRRELEKNGLVLRFCDYCYWGEVQAEDTPEAPQAPVEGRSGEPKPNVAPE